MIVQIKKGYQGKKQFLNGIYILCMIAASLFMLYPLLWMASSSLKENQLIFATATDLIPDNPTLQNYTRGWAGFAGLDFGLFFSNSLLIAGISSVGSMLSAAFGAFGFARLRFPGRKIWFVIMILTMMLPYQVMQISRFVLFKDLGWIGTYLPMTLPSFCGSAFNIFLVMQFIRGIPVDMDEAARMDGCSWYRIFFSIVMPLIIPAMVTVLILSFIGSWGDYISSMMYLNTPKMYTAAYALKMFSDNTGTDYGATFAMSTLSLMPIMVLFFFFQKQLIEGCSFDGLKG